MTWSQLFVVKWIEWNAAACIMLLISQVAVRRLRQPADRINLIAMSFLAAALIPPLLSLAKAPAWHLAFVERLRPVATTLPSTPSEAAPMSPSSTPKSSGVNELKQIPSPTSVNPPQVDVASHSSNQSASLRGRIDFRGIVAIGLLTIQCLAIAVLVVEWGIGVRCLRGISARASPAGQAVRELWASISEGRSRSTQLLISSQVSTPLTYGGLRTTVVIPKSIAAGDLATLRYCLAHEWAHIKNADLVTWRMARLCQFGLCFQPVFWMLRRELYVCQDFLADHRAACAGQEAVEYSALLVAFARRRMSRPISGAFAFFDQSSQLSRRIHMLLNSSLVLRPRSQRTFCVAAGLMSLSFAVAISLVRLESAGASDGAQPAAVKKLEDAKPNKAPRKPRSDTAETLRYTGTILDKVTGQAIPGATVVVRRSKLSPQQNDLIAETRHETDAQGKYSFEIPPEQVAVAQLYIELDVEHDDYAAQKGFGYALSMIRKNEGLGERPFFEKVELRPSESITGTVVAPDGSPLPGIKILGYSKSDPSDFRDYGSFTESKTDDTGRFRLNLVKGGGGVFWVLPTEFASTSREVHKQRGDIGEIQLRPGVRVSGRVLSADGQPVENIPVNIQYQGGGNESVNNLPVTSSIRRSAVTDRDGHFAFDPLPTGDYRVIPEEHRSDPIVRDRTRYDIPGVFLPKTVKILEGVASPAIELQTAPHVIFNAQILDSKGAKTRGHEVMLFGQLDGNSWFGRGRPDVNGTIALRVPHGLQNVQLNLITNEHGALRFRRGAGKELENERSRIELGTLNDDVEGFEIIRYRAPIVLINAVDAEKKPVKDFRLTAVYAWGKQDYILEGELRSDLSFEHQNDGRYRTSQLLPDEDVKFTVTAPGYEAASETVRLGEGETKDLVVELKKSAPSKPE